MKGSTILAIAAVIAAVPTSLSGQAPVAPEQVVRIHAPPAGVHTPTLATVIQAGRDTLVVQTSVPDTVRGGRILDQRVIPLASVWSLEVPVGTRSRARGAALGGVVGTAAGLTGATLHWWLVPRGERAPCEPETSPRECVAPTRGPYPVSRSLVITLVGTAVGSAAGAVWSGRHWRHVFPVATEAGVTGEGGVRVGGTVRF